MHNLKILSSPSILYIKKSYTINSSIKNLTYTTTNRFNEDTEKRATNPLKKTINVIGRDLQAITRNLKDRLNSKVCDGKRSEVIKEAENFQTHCDILIIGGSGIGSSICYWIKEKARNGLNVVVVENDKAYDTRLPPKTYHGLQFNFSIPENIQMALYSAEFLKDIKDHLGNVNVNFTPYGSLQLASQDDAINLQYVSKVQNEMGLRTELLSPSQIKSKFPWINVNGIALGCHGLERQGCFDTLALIFGYKNKALEYGAHYIQGNLVDFEFKSTSNVQVEGEESENYKSLDKAVVKMPNGEEKSIKFALCVIASDLCSEQIAKIARIGQDRGLLCQPLTLEQRKRKTYILSTASRGVPIFSTPLTIDSSGYYLSREGLSETYLCGITAESLTEQIDFAEYAESSTEEINRSAESAEKTFYSEIQPILEQRIDSFKGAIVKHCWQETYEFNYFDKNGIIGAHPYYNNLYIAAGFNTHGIQYSPCIGRAISELIIDGRYRTIDLSRLSFDRILVDKPLL